MLLWGNFQDWIRVNQETILNLWVWSWGNLCYIIDEMQQHCNIFWCYANIIHNFQVCSINVVWVMILVPGPVFEDLKALSRAVLFEDEMGDVSWGQPGRERPPPVTSTNFVKGVLLLHVTVTGRCLLLSTCIDHKSMRLCAYSIWVFHCRYIKSVFSI